MQCPKCSETMKEVLLDDIEIDQCTGCSGIWFDKGEAEELSKRWIAEFVDTGDAGVGEKMDEIESIDCPRCEKKMRNFFDLEGSQVQYEQCDEHGKFFDAGEFVLWAENQFL